MSVAIRRRWFQLLLERMPYGPPQNRLEWLKTAPRSRRGRSLDQAFLKVHFLYDLGIQRYLEPQIAFEKLRGYARRLTRTKTSRFNQLGAAIKRCE